jgi:hypothetical protein
VGLNVSGIGIPIDGHARAQSPGKSVHPDRFHSGDGGAPHLTAEVPGSRGVSIVQDAGLLAWDHPVPSENRPSRAAPGLARAAGHPGGVPRNAPTRAPVPTAVATDPPSVGQADRSPNRGGGVGVEAGAVVAWGCRREHRTRSRTSSPTARLRCTSHCLASPPPSLHHRHSQWHTLLTSTRATRWLHHPRPRTATPRCEARRQVPAGLTA